MCGNFQLVPPTALIAQNKSQVSTFEGHVPMMWLPSEGESETYTITLNPSLPSKAMLFPACNCWFLCLFIPICHPQCQQTAQCACVWQPLNMTTTTPPPTGLPVSKQVPEPKVTHINIHARSSTLITYMTETWTQNARHRQTHRQKSFMSCISSYLVVDIILSGCMKREEKQEIVTTANYANYVLSKWN